MEKYIIPRIIMDAQALRRLHINNAIMIRAKALYKAPVNDIIRNSTKTHFEINREDISINFVIYYIEGVVRLFQCM